MTFIPRTLSGLICAASLAFGLPALAAEKVNIGVVTGPTFVHTLAANKFKEAVDKALPGKYDIVVHHSAALGSETQVLQQLQLGTVQMSVCTTGPVEAFVPEIKALEMPFLFSSYEATDKVLDGPIGQDLLKRFDKAGLVGMHFLDNGFRNVTNSKQAVKGPDDLKGMKIRTMESPTHLAIWRAIGANPTPMAWPITTQLQQGVLDGQENPVSVISAAKLNEAGQKYLTMTRHVYSQGLYGYAARSRPQGLFGRSSDRFHGRAALCARQRSQPIGRPESRWHAGGGQSRFGRFSCQNRTGLCLFDRRHQKNR